MSWFHFVFILSSPLFQDDYRNRVLPKLWGSSDTSMPGTIMHTTNYFPDSPDRLLHQSQEHLSLINRIPKFCDPHFMIEMAESITAFVPVDNPDVPAGRKRFIPLENNPEVMNTLVYKLGLSKTLSFHDVFSIDYPDLLAFVPRPANALLLVFPVSDTYEKYRMEEDAQRPLYDGKGVQEPVIWYRQTIGNACGLMGLLHAVSNGSAKDYVEPQSDLAKLIHDAIPLAPTERADLLYNSEALEHAHQSAATQGQTSAPNAEDKIDLHYVCFVKDQATNQLWELDGRRKGPLNRGVLAAEDDVLSEKALELSVRKFIQREQVTPGGELRFSLVTLSPSLD